MEASRVAMDMDDKDITDCLQFFNSDWDLESVGHFHTPSCTVCTNGLQQTACEKIGENHVGTWLLRYASVPVERLREG